MHPKELVPPVNFIVTSPAKKLIIAEIIKKCSVFYGNECIYNVHKSPLLDSTLGKLNLVHTLTLCLFKNICIILLLLYEFPVFSPL
jgi:hypothetical protein